MVTPTGQKLLDLVFPFWGSIVTSASHQSETGHLTPLSFFASFFLSFISLFFFSLFLFSFAFCNSFPCFSFLNSFYFFFLLSFFCLFLYILHNTLLPLPLHPILPVVKQWHVSKILPEGKIFRITSIILKNTHITGFVFLVCFLPVALTPTP